MEYFGYATECWIDHDRIDAQIAFSLQDGHGNELNNYLVNGTDLPISKITPEIFRECQITNPKTITNSSNGDAFAQELLNLVNQSNMSANGNITLVGFDYVDRNLFDHLTSKTSEIRASNYDITDCLNSSIDWNDGTKILTEARKAAFNQSVYESCPPVPVNTAETVGIVFGVILGIACYGVSFIGGMICIGSYRGDLK